MHFQVSRSSRSPEMRQMKPTSASTFRIGAPLRRNATDPEQVEEHPGGATVTGIIGTAMAGVTAGVPAYSDHTYDVNGTIPVYIATDEYDWLGTLINAGTVVTPAKATHEGVSYGMIKVNGEWYIDEADTTALVARVVRALPEINAVLFRWITSAIAA